MTSEQPAISDFMTEFPATVEVGMLLGDALDRMYQDNIRHLPVVDEAGKLVGMLSTRDVAAAAALRGIEPMAAKVEAAMAPAPFTCAEHSPLVAVIERMESDRLGSVVVTKEGKPSGIFTTTDAMRVLRSLLMGKTVDRLVEPDVEASDEAREEPATRPHIRSARPSKYDGMVSWFLTKV
ncbi:CBS domain-containing protein [Pseudenhygromyxa sp. WMMC2535]|uniref:CBS domain-containing protein n=1 Tax=Pseudenhygromyxa sp. WMMC2535 TaxID=2712867 RepID=UPI001551FE07|nr:CBS domain-containing protein [Pseudenhygromyxa sp. WMMC2535]NVB37330.1 CBS domain-containing protein [Pseudenhygromyxa sp. WMMC2535]